MTNHESVRPLTLMPRRRLLKGVTLISGVALTGLASPWADVSASTGPGLREIRRALNLQTPQALDAYEPLAFTPAELATFKAASDRIIPSDELGPGATEAGVYVYVDQALAGNSAALLPVFQAGLAALDAAAGEGGFVALDPDAQDAILISAEAGELADAPANFFALLRANTRAGFFNDPIHGGNRDFVGWDLIGYPGIKLSWTEAEQQIDAVVEPLHISVEAFQGES